MRSVPKSTRRTGCGTTRRWCSRVPVEFSRRGLCGNARLPRHSKLASAALGPAKGRDVEFAAAFALAVSGELSESQRLAEDLAKRFPEDPPVRFEYLPTLHALFALSQKAPTDHREAPSAGGQAHLQAGRGREAAGNSGHPPSQTSQCGIREAIVLVFRLILRKIVLSSAI